MLKINNISDPQLLQEIEAKGKLHHFKAGDVIVQNETFMKSIPLVVSGNIKVFRVHDGLHEMFMYYVGAGQACAVSLSSCLTSKQSKIKAVAEEDSTIISIPANLAYEWYENNKAWRMFVFQTLEGRIEELFETIDTIAFSKVDERILTYLDTKTQTLKTDTLQITHQEIANELSTSREVVSRILKKLEMDGLVSLGRNKIVVLKKKKVASASRS